MSTHDQLQRFLFEQADVRGHFVQLDRAYVDAIGEHNYPPALKKLLSQFLAATTMLSTTLKFEGTVTLQAQSKGPLSAIMADCSNHADVRCIAQYDEDVDPAVFDQPFNELLAGGALAITIDPEVGQRYQGIVPLEKPTLGEALTDYFQQSEQLPTKFWMFEAENHCAALMLQVLPGENVLPKSENEAFFSHVGALADTLTAEEATTLDAHEVLHRLYHEEAVRIYDPKTIQFKCTCSDDKIAQALSSVPKAELLQAMEETDGILEVDCQFCNKRYTFDEQSLDFIYSTDSKNVH